MSSPFKYKFIALGGTFDQIHKGHKQLLERAFETGESVFIGLTSDKFAASSGKKIQHNFDQREKQLREFLDRMHPGRNFVISKLEDRFGPGIFTKNIDAIAVSTETLGRVEEANSKRRSMGLPDLKVEIVQIVIADDNNRISSTRIRAGEIDAEGRVLRKLPGE
ncbi:MAG: pantetheine-phosphate adenylyltransferase [Thaumarchaeota archaeon]|nr:pantetheine-phosphate adenylyltransferase [Nitrososphaerota archaeon]